MELIQALEAPRPAEDQYNRSQSNKSITSSTYTVSPFDYVLQADTSAGNVTLTLPESKNDGWEVEIIKPSPMNRVIILPTGTDTLVGDTQVDVYDQWTALRFRAVSGGYVLI